MSFLFILLPHLRSRRQHITSFLDSLDLGIRHLKDVLSEMLHALHDCHILSSITDGACSGIHLARHKLELCGLGEEFFERGAELEAGFEERAAAEDIQS